MGATQPTEYGDYFAWGETSPKENDDWSTYKWCKDSAYTLTKYCADSKYGTVDNLTTLLAEDDAATANWGEGWRMPTKAELQELRENCFWDWTNNFNDSGVAGRIGTSRTNDNTIFLPAAGFRRSVYFNYVGNVGSYWCSSLDENNSNFAYCFRLHSSYYDSYVSHRYFGQSVRAVVKEKDNTYGTYQDVTVSGKVGNYTYVDLGLPSGTKWATYNVGATQPTEYGDYFAWGEIEAKKIYSWETYEWFDGSHDTKIKYCENSVYGTDDGTTLLAEDDAATQNWGDGWRMPTHAEHQELIDGCTWEWTTNFNGSSVAGRIGTSKSNGNSIFLPAAGFRRSVYFNYVGNVGCECDYWSSSLYEDDSNKAYFLNYPYLFHYDDYFYREIGMSIRAVVREKDTTKTDTIETYAHDVIVSGQVGNYTYVDLGLPSGMKWATYNVGATQPTDYGDYFAWGETTPKANYSWETYKWCKGSADITTKYCKDIVYGTNDNLTLLTEDDAATANWGEGWRMPTKTEMRELKLGCDWKWVHNFNNSGVAGYIGASKKNGHIIFLPAAGYCYGTNLIAAGYDGTYWSSSLYEYDSNEAFDLYFYSDNLGWDRYYRNYGKSIRAVVREKDNTTGTLGVTVSGKVGNYTYVDLGLLSGIKWATYNVGANKPTDYGDYFAWGEIEAKIEYSWNTYKWTNDGGNSFTKYSEDGRTTLSPSDDAATANWGEEWRMPTEAELQELRESCYWDWTNNFNDSGVAGYIGTSKKNGHTIFLPAAGDTGNDVFYWSTSLYESNLSQAYCLNNYSDYFNCNNYYRYNGCSVRAVVREDVTVSGQVGDYNYVDLGLPSGTKWATYNVGASKPTEYGDYFAWGETTAKEDYSRDTYKYEEESYKSMNDGEGSWIDYSKYTIADGENQYADSVAWYDSNGNFIGDNLTTLLAEDDAATANWGEGWRMPTVAEQQELLNGCNWKWTKDFNGSGVAGRVGISKTNGNTIFLPAAGDRYGKSFDCVGIYGTYWSSSLDEDDSYYAYHLNFTSRSIGWYDNDRGYGQSVRAVVREK